MKPIKMTYTHHAVVLLGKVVISAIMAAQKPQSAYPIHRNALGIYIEKRSGDRPTSAALACFLVIALIKLTAADISKTVKSHIHITTVGHPALHVLANKIEYFRR